MEEETLQSFLDSLYAEKDRVARRRKRVDERITDLELQYVAIQEQGGRKWYKKLWPLNDELEELRDELSSLKKQTRDLLQEIEGVLMDMRFL